MLIHYYGRIFRTIFPFYTWRKHSKEKVLYLTFDDGPIPDVTEYVIDTLKNYGIKATFFCVGDNVRKHPGVFRKLLEDGHQVANHTQNHLNGKKNDLNEYLKNVDTCDDYLGAHNPSKLFRPPYGMLSRGQRKQLAKTHEIVMWEVLSGDFHPKISKEKCLKKSIQNTRRGSIVLFHDSIKSYDKIKYALPKYLEHFLAQGYRFETL